MVNGQCVPIKLVASDASSFFGKNCNPSQIDGNVALAASSEDVALRYILARRVDWLANEWTLPSILYPRIHHYVVTMRSPISRVISHCGSHKSLQELQACASSPDQWNFATTRLAACDEHWRSFSNLTKVSSCSSDRLLRNPFKAWVPSQFNTMHALAQFFAQPEMLQSAMTRLMAFETVLILERFREAPPLLQNSFKWTKSLNLADLHKGTHQNTPQRVSELKGLALKLQRYNQNDLQLLRICQ